MTTYFEHNANTKEPFEPRKEDVVDWPDVVVSEPAMTAEEWRRLYLCEWPLVSEAKEKRGT